MCVFTGKPADMPSDFRNPSVGYVKTRMVSAGVVDTLCKPVVKDNSYNTENSVLTPRCSTYIQILNIYNNTMKQSHYLVNTFSHSYSACSIRTNRMVRKVHKSTFCCKQKNTTSE
uniref:Uncharacterized protein n=1 Tax=Nothobranchius rachovii TaxID=451742 RepID=A0A1A8RNH6_9TELE